LPVGDFEILLEDFPPDQHDGPGNHVRGFREKACVGLKRRPDFILQSPEKVPYGPVRWEEVTIGRSREVKKSVGAYGVFIQVGFSEEGIGNWKSGIGYCPYRGAVN
jgi:hypothetical protein